MLEKSSNNLERKNREHLGWEGGGRSEEQPCRSPPPP
jgi:hypothetical protein